MKLRKICLAACIALLAALCLSPGAAFAQTGTTVVSAELTADAIVKTDDATGMVFYYEANKGPDGAEDGTLTLRLIVLDAIAETHATDVAIPAQVEHGGRTYTVTAIDHDHDWGHISYDDSGGSNADIFGENIQFPEAGSHSSSAYPSDNLASLTSISVPATVTKIGNASFNGCTGVTSVTFGEGSALAYVSNQAFRYCRSLRSVTLPDSVEVLGTGISGTFDRCTALESVNIPASLTELRGATFAGCVSLKTVKFPADSKLSVIWEDAFVNCTSLESISIPASVTELSGFAECTSLADLDLSKATNLSVIGGSAFRNMKCMTSFEIPATVTRIGSEAFADTSLRELVIPETVQSLGSMVINRTPIPYIEVSASQLKATSFYRSNLSRVKIASSDNAVVLPLGLFERSSKLQTLVLDGDAGKFEVARFVFQRCTALKAIVFTGDVSEIEMPEAAMFSNIAGNAGLAFYGWDRPYDESAGSNAALPTWCQVNGFAYRQLQDTSKIAVSVDASQVGVYDGTAKTPQVTVKDGETALVEGTDYEVIYSTDNTSAGTMKGRVFGLGAYSAYRSEPFTFEVAPADISGARIAGIAAQPYTGSPAEPALSVALGEGEGAVELVAGRDYEASYSANVDAGTATATATGKGNYAGSVSATFEIAPADISSAVVAPVPPQLYKGAPVEPTLAVSDAFGNALVAGRDYDVAYSGNAAPGEAVASLSGKGNYTGSAEVRFQVVERFFAEWSRLWGDDALGTMSAVSRAGFAASDAVVVASAEGYWDALSASPLAGALGAPVLLTASGSLSPEAAAEAARLGASKAYVVGGPASVSPAVADALAAAGLEVERVAGDDAPGTAAAVAAALGAGSSSTCVVATSATYQDALSAGPYAYAERSPVFLTGPDGSLSEATLAAVAASGCSRAIVAGGEMSVPAGARAALEAAGLSVVRLAGDDAYGTSAEMALWCISQGMSADGACVATCEGYWDALSGAALCGSRRSVLVLADEGRMGAVERALSPSKTLMSSANVLGGEMSVPASVLAACRAATA